MCVCQILVDEFLTIALSVAHLSIYLSEIMETIDDAELDQILGMIDMDNVEAGPSSGMRDKSVEDDDVAAFIQSKKKVNTVKSTNRDVSNVQRWLLVNKLETREIENIPPEELDRYLSQMWISIRKTDGSEYEPGSLHQIKSSVDRYLREKTGGKVTIRSDTFHLSNSCLVAKKQDLKQQGLGRRENKALPVTEEEENLLWEKKQLGTDRPTSLQFTVFFMLSKGMGFRGREQHRKLRFGDLRRGQNSQGIKYIEFLERDSKTMDGSGKNDFRSTVPRIYSDGTDRDPISIFDKYIEHRPQESCTEESPLYLTPIPAKRLRADEIVWYYNTPMGQNTLGQLMKNACAAAGIEGKKTNHSLRKTTVKTLQKANVPPHKIIQMTGHKNPASLQSYDDELEEQEQIRYSHLLSNRASTSSSMPEHHPPASEIRSATSNNNIVLPPPAPMAQIMTSPSMQNFMSVGQGQSSDSTCFPAASFYGATLQNCTINFNVQPPLKRRRVAVIESDSSQSQ